MAEDREIGGEIKRLSNLIRRRIGEELGSSCENGPTGEQGMIIGYIARHPDEEIFQKDIEAKFKIRRSTATGTLQLMEKNGLITRIPVERDARLKRIRLTEKAVGYHNCIEQAIKRIEGELRQNLSAAELESFFVTVDKIRANLSDERNNCGK